MTNFTPLQKNKQQKSNLYYYLLAILLIFHLTANIIWIKLNQNPVDFDPVGHTLISINMANYIKMNLLDFNLGDFLKISSGYPVFTHIVGAAIVLIFGVDWKLIQFSGTIFFLLTILVIFLYIKEITNKKSTAFFTTFFYSFLISIIQYSRLHMLDIPLTFFIFLTMYFWERLKKTGKTRFIFLSAISLGLAQATKWHAIIFLLVPILSLIIHIKRTHLFVNKKIIWSSILSFILFIVISCPWYIYNFSNFIRLGVVNYRGEADDPQNLLSWNNIISYPWLVINFQIQFIGFVFLIVSLFFNRFRLKKYLIVPLLILGSTYILFTFFVINKNIRVIFPLMPLVALFIALFFEKNLIKDKNILVTISKYFINGVLIGFILVSFFILSFGWPWTPNKKISMKLPLLGWTDLIYLDTDPVNLIYSKESIAYQQIINQLLIQAETKESGLNLVNAVNLPYFHQGHLPLMIYQKYSNDINYANNEILNKKLLLNDVSKFIQQGAHFEDIDAFVTVEKNPVLLQSQADQLYEPVKKIHQYLYSQNNIYFYSVAYFPMPANDRLVLFIKR